MSDISQARIGRWDRKERTHCKFGHLYDEGNTGWKLNRKGYLCRECRECGKLRMQRKREKPDFLAREAASTARWREKYPEKNRESWQRAEREKRQLLLDARAGGCVVCGEKDPSCLDFHHRDPSTKEGHIGEFRHFGTKRVLAEIAKCDVLCANCHRKHHRDERQRISEGV